jgi:nucleoporin GLE1
MSKVVTNGQGASAPQQDVRNRPPSRKKTPPSAFEHPDNTPRPAQLAINQPQSFNPPPFIRKSTDLLPSSQATKAQVNQQTAVRSQAHESAPRSSLPGADRYLEIHKSLKQLRSFVTEHAKQDPGLKKKMGEMRREIRKSVGQLTEGKGANRIPVSNSQFVAL